MNILLIIFSPELINQDVFKDRISSLGDTLYIYDNIAFVETEYNTREVYLKLSANEYEQSLILVLYVKDELLGFWGRMKTELWDWLDEKAKTTDHSIENSYKQELERLISEKNALEERIKELSANE